MAGKEVYRLGYDFWWWFLWGLKKVPLSRLAEWPRNSLLVVFLKQLASSVRNPLLRPNGIYKNHMCLSQALREAISLPLIIRPKNSHPIVVYPQILSLAISRIKVRLKIHARNAQTTPHKFLPISVIYEHRPAESVNLTHRFSCRGQDLPDRHRLF